MAKKRGGTANAANGKKPTTRLRSRLKRGDSSSEENSDKEYNNRPPNRLPLGNASIINTGNDAQNSQQPPQQASTSNRSGGGGGVSQRKTLNAYRRKPLLCPEISDSDEDKEKKKKQTESTMEVDGSGDGSSDDDDDDDDDDNDSIQLINVTPNRKHFRKDNTSSSSNNTNTSNKVVPSLLLSINQSTVCSKVDVLTNKLNSLAVLKSSSDDDHHDHHHNHPHHQIQKQLLTKTVNETGAPTEESIVNCQFYNVQSQPSSSSKHQTHNKMNVVVGDKNCFPYSLPVVPAQIVQCIKGYANNGTPMFSTESFRHRCGPSCLTVPINWMNGVNNPLLKPLELGFTRQLMWYDKSGKSKKIKIDYDSDFTLGHALNLLSITSGGGGGGGGGGGPTGGGGSGGAAKKTLIYSTASQDAVHNRQLQIVYVTPCGKLLCSMWEVHRFLVATNVHKQIDIQLFTFTTNFSISSQHIVANYYVADITNGEEPISISAINWVDNEPYTASFTYIRERRFHPMIGHNFQIPEKYLTFECSCECDDLCSNPETCVCRELTIKRNEFRSEGYSFKRNTFHAPRGIYECNPNCKCTNACHNRVVQNGLKLELQVFRVSDATGWGVRTLHFVPRGTFICTYSGLVLTNKLQELISRQSSDHFCANLYDDSFERFNKKAIKIAKKHNRQEQVQLLENSRDNLFILDGLHYANIGRLFNHSCDPNAFSQQVYADTHHSHLPTIALFAFRDIQPYEEIVWDYNWSLCEDSEEHRMYCKCGNIKCKFRLR